MLEISQENRIIDLPDLNRFQIGDKVIVDESGDYSRFEGGIIGIELRRVCGSDRLEPCITLLHDGCITDEFKPTDCRKVNPDAIAAKDREIAEIRQRTIEECAVYHDNKAQNFKVIAETETVKSTAERARLAVVFHEASAAALRSLGKEGSGEQ